MERSRRLLVSHGNLERNRIRFTLIGRIRLGGFGLLTSITLIWHYWFATSIRRFMLCACQNCLTLYPRLVHHEKAMDSLHRRGYIGVDLSI